MSDLMFIKTKVGLVPHTLRDKEFYDKWGLGEIISGKFKRVRKPEHHRRFFGLLNLAFEYYEPSSGVLSRDEKRMATKIFRSLDNYNEKNGFMLEWGREFLKSESRVRRTEVENIQNAFEPFRKDMIISAGYYKVHRVPTGTVKIADSISFASMGEDEFQLLYAAVFNACWRLVLDGVFESQEEAKKAALQMLEYDR